MKANTVVASVAMSCALSVSGAGLPMPSQGRPFLIINEDNDHYFKMSSERMTQESLEAYIDDMAKGGQVTHVFFCTCGQRASYDSKVWEPIWVGMEQPDLEGRTHNIWCVNAKKLYDAGIDPYAVWIRRCRERGISPWVSMRMNDVHFVDHPDYFRNTTHWRTRKDLWRNPQAKMPCSWDDCAYDYAKPEVQEYHFAMVKELLDRYDADGIELDWMRFGHHLTPGREREQAPCLTAFLRRVRDYANRTAERLGHAVHVGVRVPTQWEVACDLGFDCEAWAREKLVDLIVPSNFYSANDFDMSFDKWQSRLLAVNPQLTVLPCATDRISAMPGPNICMDKEYFRGWSDIMYSQQAKGLYFFNIPYLAQRDEFYVHGMAPERLRGSRRRYPVSWHDCTAKVSQRDIQLPVDMAAGKTFHLQAGNVAGIQSAAVIIGFKTAPSSFSEMSVLLNGIAAGEARPIEPGAAFCGGPEVCGYAVQLPVAPAAVHEGTNSIEVRPLGTVGQAQIVWCEILVE